LLGPLTKLRFAPISVNVAWGVAEAVKDASLVFTAWDGTDGLTSGDSLVVDAPFCSAQKVRGA